MRSNSCTSFFITCVVLLSLFTTIKSDDASNYYAKYYRDYYNGIAGRLLTLFSGTSGTARESTGYSAPAATYSEPASTYSEPEYQAATYDPSFDVGEMFGPETGSILGIASLLLGVINLIAFIAMDSRVTSLENDQNSICASTKTLGNLALTSVATATTTALQTTANAAALNTIITTLNGVATPTC